MLINYRADPNYLNYFRYIALIKACSWHIFNVLDVLLRNRIDIYQKGGGGETLLVYLCRRKINKIDRYSFIRALAYYSDRIGGNCFNALLYILIIRLTSGNKERQIALKVKI